MPRIFNLSNAEQLRQELESVTGITNLGCISRHSETFFTIDFGIGLTLNLYLSELDKEKGPWVLVEERFGKIINTWTNEEPELANILNSVRGVYEEKFAKPLANVEYLYTKSREFIYRPQANTHLPLLKTRYFVSGKENICYHVRVIDQEGEEIIQKLTYALQITAQKILFGFEVFVGVHGVVDGSELRDMKETEIFTV